MCIDRRYTGYEYFVLDESVCNDGTTRYAFNVKRFFPSQICCLSKEARVYKSVLENIFARLALIRICIDWCQDNTLTFYRCLPACPARNTHFDSTHAMRLTDMEFFVEISTHKYLFLVPLLCHETCETCFKEKSWKKIKIKIDGERKKVSHKFRTIQPHRLELACVCIHTRTEKMNEKESDWGGITHTLNFTSKSKCCADEENMKQIIISIKKKVKKWENENMRLIYMRAANIVKSKCHKEHSEPLLHWNYGCACNLRDLSLLQHQQQQQQKLK